MRHAEDAHSELGGADSVTLVDSSTALNFEVYASPQVTQARTGFPKQSGQSLS